MATLVSLIGAGPGDPGLLTLLGARRIAEADTVLCDALVHRTVLRHARHDAELLVVGKRGGEDSATQDEILHTMVFRARQGRRVARVKGGDPMIFGRAAEEMAFLRAEGIAYEVVPGVTAALGASAYAAIPLTHRDLASSVAFVTATERPERTASQHDWSRLATATQTLVIYMGLRRLRETLRELVAHGRPEGTAAAAVSHATLPTQRVVRGTVADLADLVDAAALPSPAVVVVGDVVSLRDSLRWWAPGPLAGRSVLVTRASEQSDGLTDALARDGADVIELAAIRVEAPGDTGPLYAAIESLAARAPEVVAFTSANGVRFFFDALRASGRDARALAGAAVVAVGPATANALRRNGIDADLVPERHVGEALADAVIALLGDRAAGARALLPRAEVARVELVAALRARGVIVDDVPTYRTVSAAAEQADELRRCLREGVDAVTFMSPSAVNSVLDALGDEAALLGGAAIASVGPVTSAALRARGLAPTVEARSYTADGLVDVLRAHFHEQRDPR